MAAHDDKISGKRRKLFKALSTVPVVLTLKPGSALANQSAFQCLDSGRNVPLWREAEWLAKNVPHCDDGDICYAYERRNYIDITKGMVVTKKDEEDNDVPVGCPPVGPIIVEVSSGTWIDLSGLGADVESDVDNGSSYRVLKNGAEVCVKMIPVEEGLFAVLGHPMDESTNFSIDGVYPVQQLSSDVQGITGTCLDSFAPGTSSSYTLSKG